MYKIIRRTFDSVKDDKPYLWLFVSILVFCMLYVLFTLLSIHSSDTQLISRYSGLGDTHFYKAKWYSLYEFSLFGVIVGVMSLVVLSKLKVTGRRNLGVIFGWITLLILVLAFVYSYQVFHLAYL